MISVHFGTSYCTPIKSRTLLYLSVSCPTTPHGQYRRKWGKVGNLTFNHANIWSRPLKSPCRLRWEITGELTHTVIYAEYRQHCHIKSPTIGEGQTPLMALYLPVQGGIGGHTILKTGINLWKIYLQSVESIQVVLAFQLSLADYIISLLISRQSSPIPLLPWTHTHTHMYTVDLVGTVDQFRGFILQARDTRTGNLIGSFIPLDNDKSHVLNCDPSFTNSQVLQFLVKFLILYLNFNMHFPPFLSPTFFPISLLPALPLSLSSSPLPSPHTLSLGNCLPQKQCSRLPTKLPLAVTTATEQSPIHSLFHVCAVYS